LPRLVNQLTTRCRLAWSGVFFALLVSSRVISAQTAQTEFYSGTIGTSSVELAFLRQSSYGPYQPSQGTDSGLFGAIYWVESRGITWRGVPLKRLHGIVGTEIKNRIVLRELTSLDDGESVAAQMVARRSGTTLQGEWRETGSSRPVPFSLSLVRFPWFLSTPGGRFRAVLSERDSALVQVTASLHRAIREGMWSRAHLDARILCALSFVWGGGLGLRHVDRPDNCGWVLPTYRFANNLDLNHGEIGVGPWSGLTLEKEGRPEDAFVLYQQFCAKESTTACALMVDVASQVASAHSRPALLTSCARWRIGCAEYWGPDVVALADAARDGNLERAQQLLRFPLNVNAGSGKFLSPLLQAVLSKSLSIVRLLLEHGADPDFVPTATSSPLYYALESSDETFALLLLDYGATMKVCEECVMNAVEGKHLGALRRLLDLGVHPDTGMAPSGSPLSVAVDQGNLAAVKLLLAHGADPDLSSNYSEGSPLDHARVQRRTDMIQLLEEASKKRR
jgi:hypothetical protein